MPEFPDSLTPKDKERKGASPLIEWYTISYSTVALWLGGLVVLVLVGLAIIFPKQWESVKRLVSGGGDASTNTSATSMRQARFTNLEGNVRVRKANQVQWTTATVSVGLEEGDTVQTVGDGLARIAFADGSLYVVKPDTLIVLEDNGSHDSQKPSNVAVQVTSGVVDLSTSKTAGESRVRFANAEARIHRESRALVTNDPNTNTHQITVSKGAATLQRGSEHVELGQYEQASFAGPASSLQKAKVVAPPILLTPANLAPVVLGNSDTTDVEFTWSVVPAANLYRLRISTSPVFATLLYDQSVRSTSVRVPAFKAGDYYWSVSTIPSNDKESQPSDADRFTVMKQDSPGELLLVVDDYVAHGRVIEVIGRTEPGATVLVNNEPVFNITPSGSFKHFTSPLPNAGENLITITAQNSKGKIATLRKTVTTQ